MDRSVAYALRKPIDARHEQHPAELANGMLAARVASGL
jgi:hypothetical protein